MTALPGIRIASPADGTTVTATPIQVGGSVRSTLLPEQIRLTLGDQVDFPQGTNWEYVFAFENIALSQGSNIISVRRHIFMTICSGKRSRRAR